MTQKDRKTPPLTVLDVSRWQGRIDWDAVQRSGKIDGVMLRVLGSKNGKPYLDPMFEEHYAACTSRGIPVGGYYYTCAVTPRQTAEELAAWPKPPPSSKRGTSTPWSTPTRISRTLPLRWTPSPPTTSGSPITAANVPPAPTGCGSIPVKAGWRASTALWI